MALRFLTVIRIFAMLSLVGCGTGDQSAFRPNIVFILADDLGYGDLGAYGQTRIQTPSLDRLADEGVRFTEFYAGSTVCAPSRSVLMTGRHLGRNEIRGNREYLPMGQHPLREETITVAELAKEAGYATAVIGKWGLGGPETTGVPNRQGFDEFFGYLCQRHAHNYYPEFLFRDEERVTIEGNRVAMPRPDGAGVAVERSQYSHDLFAREALQFITAHADEPFFLYLPLTIPHANNEAGEQGMEVPDYGTYADEDWPDPQKGLAAMISRMDRDVGRILTKLDELELADRTVVMFASDNGPHAEGGNDPEFFDSNGSLRGIKRSLYEGGIRIPMIVRWPGRVPAGKVSAHVGYLGDLMSTVADLAGIEPPEGLDSISFVQAALGNDAMQETHEFLYWELYEGRSAQAVRWGPWKSIRQPMFTGPIELYDLRIDPGERFDVAEQHPQTVERIRHIMESAHTHDPLWTVIGGSSQEGRR